MIGNILIVDDESDALKLLNEILINNGYEVRSFNNGKLALRSMGVESPDLIILDIHMPDMSGYDVCQELHKTEGLKEIPVIFISAASNIADKVRAFQEGGVDYITKPFQKEEILARVKTHIDLSHTIKRMKNAESELQKMVARYQALLDATPDGLIISDNEGKIILVNKEAEKIFGYTTEEFIGQRVEFLIPERFLSKHITHRQEYNKNPSNRPMGVGLELYATHKDLHEFPVEIGLSTVETAEGMLITATVRDISERKRAEMYLEELAHFDPVTHLPNRAYFYEILKKTIEDSRLEKKEFALLYLDLDDFKKINDSLGHHIGDNLLKSASKKILASTKVTDFVARLGGDEFVILITEKNNLLLDATHLAQHIIASFQSPFFIENNELHCSMSIGIALYPKSGSKVSSLMKNADLAMYKAKKVGKNTYQFFSEELNKEYKRQMLIESHLRHAIEKNEFTLVYQPLLSLVTGKIYGFEVLLRWYTPGLGEVGPTEFIPIAENMGLISEIGEWVLERACLQYQLWEREYPRFKKTPLILSVNISVLQLTHDKLALKLSKLMHRLKFKPNHLMLEVTETALMNNLDLSINELQTIYQLGVGIAIDDFGTGYSSLNYLKKLPFTSLKIAQSFVKDVVNDPGDASIVTAIIQLGFGLGLVVTAEGIETEQQLNFFKQAGCHYGQGYYLSYPLSSDELIKYVESYQ